MTNSEAIKKKKSWLEIFLLYMSKQHLQIRGIRSLAGRFIFAIGKQTADLAVVSSLL